MIPLFKVYMPESAPAAVGKTLMSGYLGQGPRVDEFERKFAPFVGSRNVVTTNSGTSAIHLALRLAGAGPGTEVITTPMTCTATNMPILERGANIVWADIQPGTGNIDPEDVKRKITRNTRAIICVHWGGYPCDLTELNAVADSYGIPIIEDAAHAFGSSYLERPIGSHSRFVCFSFQAIKNLTTGDGGAVVCREPDDYERAKLLRWYGIDRNAKSKDLRCEADISEYGYKFHMNDLAATIGLEQLKEVDRLIQRHRENAEYYRTFIMEEQLSGIDVLDSRIDRTSSAWLFTILVRDRDEFMKWMKESGIMTSQVHARNDLHTAFRKFRCDLPGLDRFTAGQVSIPVGWWVNEESRRRIAHALAGWSMM